MMNNTGTLKQEIQSGAYDQTFSWLYASTPLIQVRQRYISAIQGFETQFGTDRDVILVSAPGRTEIGGNHTDHQHGVVLAGAVNLDCLAVVSKRDNNRIYVASEGHAPDDISLDFLTPQIGERERAGALIRGVAAYFVKHGFQVGGLDAYTTSQVLSGSGLSSSAAFEIALGGMLNYLYNDGKIGPAQLAMAGQYAENVFFGKPSGLMDQMSCSVGGIVKIDFASPANPLITPVVYNFASSGYHLCIVDTKGSHADLTADYAAIPYEMGLVAKQFDKEVLREVDEAAFLLRLPDLREITGDRAVLRAQHFFEDSRRAGAEADALIGRDFQQFLTLITASGHSSAQQLQNAYSLSSPQEQGLFLGLSLSRRVLGPRGACRIHGGGFAGTIQAFVPDDLLEDYRRQLDHAFGAGSCHVLTIRPLGGTLIQSNT